MTGKVNYNLDIVYWNTTPIRFYYNSGENPTNIKNIIVDMTNYYSGKFTVHPFEKNGFCTAPAPGFTWGGMENQTLTTLQANNWGTNLVSHEYAHQWYGDMITCGTWADIWLNEGFATYAEALWYERTGGYSSYKSDINSDASSYLSGNPGWPMYNPSWAEVTPNNNTLFNYAITYAKGACVLHMLRYVLSSNPQTDTVLFFNCLRGYASDTANFRYKNAVTDDFTTKISQITGQNLAWFIDQWVKQPNHPVYGNIYQFTTNGGNNWSVGFQAIQTQSNTPFHRMPLTVRITFASGPDSTFRIDNTANYQIWWWNSNRQPTAFAFDPNNDIVLKQGTTVQGIIQGVNTNNELPFVYALHQNYPNPFNPVTYIKFDIPKKSFVTLKIYNVIGELVTDLINETREPGKYEVVFDGTSLSSGVYYYEIKAGDFTDVKKMLMIK
jgi:aminopeptidase N